MNVKVKICGVKTPEIAEYAITQGADYIGVVFFEKSPRNIDFKTAEKIRQSLNNKAKIVAVTVNPDDDFIDAMLKEFTPDYIQLHGNETPERAREIKKKFNLKIIKAIAVSELEDLQKANNYKNIAEFILFDAKPPKNSNLPGGNAISFDWKILENQVFDFNFILSGGLDFSNVQQALSITNAKFVDVSSGVEEKFGEKSELLIKKFITAVKN
jgi:phosphoribosylanthranilate isomerase